MLARLVVEKGLASQEEVAACEQEQRRIAESGDYKPLEEILTERGVISAGDAEKVARESEYRLGRSEDEELAQLAADEGILPRDQLDECLDEQSQEWMVSGRLVRIGALLVQKGYATPQTSVRILEARERREKERAAAGQKPSRPSTAMIPAEADKVQAGTHDDQLFAKLAVQKNFVNREQLQECLEEQGIAKRYGQYVFIGDLLRDKSFISKEQYHGLLRMEEVTAILQQDMLFAKVGLQIQKLKREAVDEALNAQREAVRNGQHPPPRIGELLFKAGALSPEDSISILEQTEQLHDKLQKKKDKWAGREKQAPDLGPLPDKRKPDRILANLAFRKKVLERDQILEAFREQEVVERYGQAIPLEKIVAGKKLIDGALLEKLVKYRDRGLVICSDDECDGFLERRKLPQGGTAKCPKCGLMLETEEAMQRAPARQVPPTVQQKPAAPAPAPAPAESTPKKKKPKKTATASGSQPIPKADLPPIDQTIDMPAPVWDEAEEDEEEESDKLGEYKIVREIGRGAMGVVYEAIQESLNRRVALKVLLDDFTLDQGSIDRFKREAESAAKLHHENIVPIFDVGEIDDVNYYAMEYVEGRTLDQLLTEESISTKRAVKIAVQIARALDYAHNKGVIHRDIKPANVMIDAADKVHLMDFGLAKQKGMNTITATDALLGTPMYMSPEQATQRGRVTGRSDIYALGVTLFEALTLEPPFRGDNFAALVVQIRDVKPPKASKVNPQVPPAVDRIVLKALAKKPEDRYATAGELADDLERFLAGEKVQAKAPSSGSGKLIPIVIAAVVLIGVGVGLWAGGVFAPSGPTPEEIAKNEAAEKRKKARAAVKKLLTEAGAALLERRPDYDRIIALLDEAAEKDAKNLDVRAARANALLRRGGDGDAARALADAALALETRDEDAALQLVRAQAALLTGSTGEAISAAGRVLDLTSGASERAKLRQRQRALLALGDALRKDGQHKRAREAYQKARKVKGLVAPGEALFGYAYTQVELRQWDDAVRTLEELDKNLPDYPGAWYLRGRAYQGLDKIDAAVKAYEKELTGDADAWHALTAPLLEQARKDLSERDPYENETASDLKTAQDYNARGVGFFRQARGLMNQGQRSRATEFLRKAVSDFGHALEKGARGELMAIFMGNRCVCLALIPDHKFLAREGLRALRDAARVPAARQLIFDAFVRHARQPRQLRSLLDQVLKDDATRADLYVMRAETGLVERRTQDALKDAEKAYQLNPKMDGAPGMLGIILSMVAERAPDAATRDNLWARAEAKLAEADGRKDTYQAGLVTQKLTEVRRARGG